MSGVHMPPALPGGFEYDCGPDAVPGWLNEEGLPTSCVGNDPNPGEPDIIVVTPGPSPEPTFTIGPVEPDLPAELPQTEPYPAEGPAAPNPPQAIELHTEARETLPVTGPIGQDVAGFGALLVIAGVAMMLCQWLWRETR